MLLVVYLSGAPVGMEDVLSYCSEVRVLSGVFSKV